MLETQDQQVEIERDLDDEYPDSDPSDYPPLTDKRQKICLNLDLEAPIRPVVLVHGTSTGTRPYDWSVFGVEACHAEVERREKLHALMTKDERELFHRYCQSRDEAELTN
jgi:hypothetical protein